MHTTAEYTLEFVSNVLLTLARNGYSRVCVCEWIVCRCTSRPSLCAHRQPIHGNFVSKKKDKPKSKHTIKMHRINKIIINRKTFLFLFTNSPKINRRVSFLHLAWSDRIGPDRVSELLVINYISIVIYGTLSIVELHIVFYLLCDTHTKTENRLNKMRKNTSGEKSSQYQKRSKMRDRNENHAELNP